ncbi:FHA domain-containing serine/threonine-protein kinase [Thermosporothrix hazakensis]|jgi:tRNA A-37 threonylcarbamoyl transferase component Bud32|nr:FHA domain-containing serine/threonine-protein kinase [Thermosporothrix hazakensis]GCE49868.1 hypothetical protein KTH_47370 [Thermosporothrix hazakensis]
MVATITFTVTAGCMQGTRFVFTTHDTLLCGRMKDCQICLSNDMQVSRHHFLLEVNPPEVRLRDLGSRNGTFVNGKKYGGRQSHETPEQGAQRQYPQVDVHDHDVIQVGRTTLEVRIEVERHVSRPIHCQSCGKDVSAEADSGRSGTYLCKSCQKRMQTEEHGIQLQSLLQRLQRQAQIDMPGIPSYEIERKIGQGGMGAVYLVRHRENASYAAMKVLLARVAVDEQMRKKFMREVEVTRSLRHKHIVEFLEYGSLDSVFYFLLEYCEGGSLFDLMQKRGGRLSLQEAGPLLLQALKGLAFAHEQGFVHRDLKPHNILLSKRDGQWIAKLADLGLAKNFEQAGLSGMTVTGEAAGSFLYMPYEQVINFKYVRPVSDIWSMGATCYHVLTGQFPRPLQQGRDPIEVVLSGEMIPIHQRAPFLPSRVLKVIDRSLAKNMEERYQHAGEMYQALAQALQEA